MNVTTATWFKPVMMLVAAALISLIVVATEKPPERVSVVDEGTLVSIFTVEKATRQLHVSAKGKVVPAVQVSVRPEVAGKVVWVTPSGAQGNRAAGIGVQFNDQDDVARSKIETYLAGALQSDRHTHTM